MKVRLQLSTGSPSGEAEGKTREVDVALSAGAVHVRLDGKDIPVEAQRIPGGLLLRMGGKVYDIALSHSQDPAVGQPGHEVQLAHGSQRLFATVPNDAEAAGKKVGAGGQAKTLKAPMPGRVVRLLVKVGDEVHAGQPVIVLEAMKMENELRATGTATVKEIHVSEGQSIENRAALVSFS